MSSALVASMVAAMCSGSPHDQACEKAVEASAHQSGYYQKIEQVEKKATDELKSTSKKVLGNKAPDVIAVGISAVSYGTGKEAKFKTERSPVSDSLTLGASKEKKTATFGWEF